MITKLLKPIIGIISENEENDGNVIATLLERYFLETAIYKSISKGDPGDRLELPKYLKNLRINYNQIQPTLVLIIRDLDKDEYKSTREVFFERCKSIISTDAVFLLFVYKIEALAAMDIQTVKQFYKVKVKSNDLPRNSKNIKTQLEHIFRYTESDMCDLAYKFDKRILYQNYNVWKDFIDKMSAFLKTEPNFD